MRHETERADDPVRWLKNARADLALAAVALPPGGMYEHLCFHAQQAVEKSLKAVLLKKGVEFPFTHNIQALLDILPAGIITSPQILDAVNLTPYATATRYPGEIEPVTEDDCREAVHIAETVVQWAESIVCPRE